MNRLATAFFVLALLLCATLAQAESSKGILLVAFGSSMASAMPSFQAIEKTYQKTFKDRPIIWAYTSDIIRKKLAKAGQKVFSVSEALNECADKGIRDLHVQSLHVTAGEEYSMLQRMLVKDLTKHPGRFTHLWLGGPLLVSSKDLSEVSESIINKLSTVRKPGEAVVLMGHGNDRGPGDLVMAEVHNAFLAKDPLIFVATVEGANSFRNILPQIMASGATTIHLAPLMVVAGDHANNDLLGTEKKSWASQLKAAGLNVIPHMFGLGELQGIRNVFLRHTQETTDDLINSSKTD